MSEPNVELPVVPAPALVVLGASAGGVESLRDVIAGLPAEFSACVLVVLHVPAGASSALPAILDRAGPLPARHAVDGDPLSGGQVLVAPPDRHLVVLGDAVALTRGPQENGHRPAVDVLFRSAARSWGARVAAVVLSGSLDDGAAGCAAVEMQGGLCLVQDFDEALYDAMPRAAAATSDVTVASTQAMPGLLNEFVDSVESLEGVPRGRLTAAPQLMETEARMSELDPTAMHRSTRPGEPAGFGCPECAGSLFQIDEGELRRFRCRVGHAWSPDGLLARQSVALESALWMALRSLEEKAALSSQMGTRAAERGAPQSAARFSSGAQEATHAAELVRQLIVQIGSEGIETTQ